LCLDAFIGKHILKRMAYVFERRSIRGNLAVKQWNAISQLGIQFVASVEWQVIQKNRVGLRTQTKGENQIHAIKFVAYLFKDPCSHELLCMQIEFIRRVCTPLLQASCIRQLDIRVFRSTFESNGLRL
jgi:hypothetical protein